VEEVAVSEPVTRVQPPPFSWQDRSVLVTGATGLLGSALTAELVARGARVVALVRDQVPESLLAQDGTLAKVTCVHGALEDFPVVLRAVQEYEVEAVFHLGAQTIVGVANRGPIQTFEANIRGTYHVLEACRLAGGVKAVIVASSDKAYGDSDVLPYDETTPLIGRHPYDVSKSCADLIAQAYWHTYGVPIAITRCGNLYGPGDLNWNRIVPGTIRSILRQEAPIIRSDGSLIRDYFYVQDGVHAYLRLAEAAYAGQGIGEAFNFSNEIQVTVLALVQKLLALMGSPLVPIVKNEVKSEIKHQYLSAAKARSSLAWTPHFTLDQGLTETIAWYRRFLTSSPSKA
jgi:CDP-glucose 4,6-dehydratase